MQTAAKTKTAIKPVLYPTVQKFLDKLAVKGGTPPYKMSPPEARLSGPNIEKAGSRWEFTFDARAGDLTITPRRRVGISPNTNGTSWVMFLGLGCRTR